MDLADSTDHAALSEPPVAFHNRNGRAPLLLLCEHASAHIPRAFSGLGLDEADRLRHIAWDIGALTLATGLADALDAPLVHATYSRLLLDLNRPVEAADSIVERSEGTLIPGNLALAPAQRAWRQQHIYAPFHAAVAALLDERANAGLQTTVVSIHSFTPTFHGQARPWHAGVIARPGGVFGAALLQALRAEPGLCIGDNEPYAPVAGFFHSIERHAESRGRPGAMIEVRQDLLGNEADVGAWVRRLARALSR